MKNRVIFIVGLTATGKSRTAIEFAKKIDGEIISCDSMQIYKGMPILTQAPSKKELSSDLRESFDDIEVHVQLIIEDIDFVNKSLEETQFFFTDIKREGKVLVNSSRFELSDSLS